MRPYGIGYTNLIFPLGAPGEAIFLARKNCVDISPKLLDVLSGELLGDGHVGMNGSRSAKYHHTSKYEEYLEWLSGIFADLGLEQSGKINKRWNKEYHCWGYRYKSKSYPELVELRERWYPNGSRIKVVPKDLELNPLICRQWFIGDGCLCNHVTGRPDIYFATCDFNKASIDHLLKELRGKGFKVTHRPANNRIGLSVYSVKDFLSWISPCPIDCYSYKWDYRDNRKSTSRQNKSEYIGG